MIKKGRQNTLQNNEPQKYYFSPTPPKPFPHKFCIIIKIVNLTLKPCTIPIKAVPLSTLRKTKG